MCPPAKSLTPKTLSNRFSSKYPRKLAGDICGDFFDKSFKMYDIAAATSSDCEMIQLYEYIIVDKMACAIFDYIF